MRIFTFIFWVLVILLGISFAAINSRSVEIHYYLGKVDVYLPLLMLVELFIGAFLGVMAMWPRNIRLKSALKKSRQEIKRLQNELDALRPTESEPN